MEDAAIFFRWTRINSTRTLPIVQRTASLLTLCLTLIARNADAIPAPDHIVVVIMENKAYTQIIGSPRAPYINDVLVGRGALLTRSFGVSYPSQPNYLQLFSGSNQGVTTDNRPRNTPFNTPNLGHKLIAAGFTFATFSQSLPYIGFKGQGYTNEPGLDKYKRKHNPAVNWQALDAPAHNHLRPEANRPFTDFPTTAAGYDALPTVSFVVPNEQNNMHDGSIAAGDTWLRQNLEGYRSWAMTHNSVLLLTFDEDDRNNGNHIPTVFVGEPIIPGRYSEASIESTPGSGVDHYNILRTIERLYGLGFCNAATDGARKAITDIFRTSLATRILSSSTRASVGTGENVIVGRFVVRGPSNKSLVLRALGPSMEVNGTPVDDVLDNPMIELQDSSGRSVAANDDWQNAQQAEIEATGLAPRNPGEAAMRVALPRGEYSVVLSGRNGATGSGLVEVYDVETDGFSAIGNVSTRGTVRGSGDAIITGFMIGGHDSARTLIRGLGPSLRGSAGEMRHVLADPILQLFDGDGNPVATNDDWSENQRGDVEATGFAPAEAGDSAILTSLAPGQYTAVLSGKHNSSGAGSIEIYNVD